MKDSDAKKKKPEPSAVLKISEDERMPVIRKINDVLRFTSEMVSTDLAEHSATWEQYARQLALLIEFAKTRLGKTCLRPAALTMAQRRELGQLVRERRQSLGLSRKQLAHRIRVSEATLKFLETAYLTPSRLTLGLLMSVEELGLSWDDIPTLLHPKRGPLQVPEAVESYRRRPGHLPIRMPLPPSENPSVQMVRQVMKSGGEYLDSAAAYLEVSTAADSQTAFSQTPALASIFEAAPIPDLAAMLVQKLPEQAVSMIALSLGSGKQEVQLAECIIGQSLRTITSLTMLNVSQPMLLTALDRVQKQLGMYPHLRLYAAQASLHDLPRYIEAVAPSLPRLFTLLGDTLSAIEAEPQWFAHGLTGCASGDFLALDVQLTATDDGSLEAIRTADFLCRDGMPPAMSAWLTHVVKTYATLAENVQLSWQVRRSQHVAKSYVLSVIASYTDAIGQVRTVNVQRFKRYNLDALVACLASCRWKVVAQCPYGTHDHRAVLLVLQRQ